MKHAVESLVSVPTLHVPKTATKKLPLRSSTMKKLPSVFACPRCSGDIYLHIFDLTATFACLYCKVLWETTKRRLDEGVEIYFKWVEASIAATKDQEEGKK